jgi:cyclic pyranopterin phosphate synthase
MQMYDLYNRKINYLRISVTDRCNLRCLYCMPEKGIPKILHSELLGFEEIARIVEMASRHGISKIRLTGGEPLVRKNITELVALLAGISGIEDLSMTTNGVLLPVYAKELRKAGLNRLNISLDTLDPDKYRKLTRHGKLEQVLEGIEAALSNGFTPVKINMVLNELTDEKDIKQVREYSAKHGLELRFIREMDREKGKFWPVEGGDGGHCQLCNRLRLSSNGYFYPCLFSDKKYSVREFGIEGAMLMALENKPESGRGVGLNKMCTIGG